MLHTDDKVSEIVELLRIADDREKEIALEFIRSLIHK